MAIGQINPTQMSARLAAMSDQQLQQFAMLHHDDPFVMAIAMDVKNQRDAVRAKAAMPPVQQQQPVVQQLIANMAQLPPMQGGGGQQMPAQQLAQPPAPQGAAPQQAADGGLMSGVAALPARNIAKMKDGGIAGYADGKEVEEGDDGSTPISRWWESIGGQSDVQKLRAQAQARYGTRAAVPGLFMQQSDAERQRAKDIVEQLPSMSKSELQLLLNTGKTPNELAVAGTGAEVERLARAYPAPETSATPAPTARRPGPSAPGAGAAPAARPPSFPGAGAAPAAPPGAAPQQGLPQLMGPPQPDALERIVSAYKPATAQDLIGQAQTIAAPWNKEIEEANKPFREQFAAERERLKKGEEQNKWQAIMQLGLGMLASRSPYALQALGEGGIQGLQMYQAAQQRDDAARKALMHSEMMMAQAERAERSGNRRDAVQLTQTAEQEKKTALQFGLQAEQIRNSKEYQQGMLSVQQGLLDVQRGRLGVEQKKVQLLGQGAADQAKARAEYGKLQIAVMRNLEKDPDYQLADPAKKRQIATARLQEAMMSNPFLSSYAAGIGFSSRPTGPTRTLTEDED